MSTSINIYQTGKYITKEAFKHKLSHHTFQKIEQKKKEEQKGLLDGHYTRLQYADRVDIQRSGGSTKSGNSTRGYIQKQNEDLNCGRCKIPIIYSSWIHSIAALWFLFALTFTNIFYSFRLYWYNHKRTTGTYICWVLSWINGIILPLFIIVQGMIKLRCKCLCKMKRLRETSFLFECLSGLIVITGAVISSMKRNDDIKWFY